MTGALLQDAVVTLVAMGAVAIVLRRAFGFFRTDRAPACANCPSSRQATRTACAAGATPAGSATTHPAVLYRRPGSR